MPWRVSNTRKGTRPGVVQVLGVERQAMFRKIHSAEWPNCTARKVGGLWMMTNAEVKKLVGDEIYAEDFAPLLAQEKSGGVEIPQETEEADESDN